MDLGLGVSTSARCFSVLLAYLMVVQGVPVRLSAQTPAPTQLNIAILEGEGAINNVRQRVARETIVQVQDENHKPVAGAAVVFLLPDHGASGVFYNGSRSLTVMTDAQGKAVARGLRPNNVAGQMEMRVSANFQGLTKSVTITQTNAVGAAAAGGAISGKLLALILVGAAGVAAGVAVAVNRGGGTPTAVVTPGTPTVGAPPK